MFIFIIKIHITPDFTIHLNLPDPNIDFSYNCMYAYMYIIYYVSIVQCLALYIVIVFYPN